MVLIDDIIMYSHTRKEYKEHIRIVLQVFREEQLFAKLKNCDFCLSEVFKTCDFFFLLKILRHVINDRGISIDPRTE